MKRNTLQRTVILDTLYARKDHPTAEELFQEVRVILPKISLGTVYRNLDLLSRKGNIRRLDSAVGPSRFDPTNDDHAHLRCPGCNRVCDLPCGIKKEQLINYGLLEEQGIFVIKTVLEFYSYCRDCMRKKI